VPRPEEAGGYQTYIDSLWEELEQSAEPRTLSQIIAAECCWMQEPREQAPAAKPDTEKIDGWARRIENSDAFRRSLAKEEKLGELLEKRDAEGLMEDLLTELERPRRERAGRERVRDARERAEPEKARGGR